LVVFGRFIFGKYGDLSTTGKLGGCYFSLVLFSKSALRLILKIKAALCENNRLISPSFLARGIVAAAREVRRTKRAKPAQV